MKISTYIILLILAFFLAIFDTSFLSFYPLYFATVLLSFSMVVILSLTEKEISHTLVFGSFATLFYTAFSSLPVYFLVIAFLLIPGSVFLIRSKVNLESNPFFAFIALFITAFLFEMILVILALDFSTDAFYSVLSFSVMNSIAGIILYFVTKKVISLIRFQEKRN